MNVCLRQELMYFCMFVLKLNQCAPHKPDVLPYVTLLYNMAEIDNPGGPGGKGGPRKRGGGECMRHQLCCVAVLGLWEVCIHFAAAVDIDGVRWQLHCRVCWSGCVCWKGVCRYSPATPAGSCLGPWLIFLLGCKSHMALSLSCAALCLMRLWEQRRRSCCATYPQSR